MVINDNGLPLTVFEHSNSEDTLFVDLLGNKHVSYSLWVLSKNGNRTEEVTVTKCSLLDIGWLNLSYENLNLSFVIVERLDIFYSQPLISLEGWHQLLDLF